MRFWAVLVLWMMGTGVCALAQPIGGDPCATERIHCFLPDDDSSTTADAAPAALERPQRVLLDVRASHGGILAHEWVQLQTSRGTVTIGYGPASIPFIDAGQISVWGEDGHIERSGLHLFPTRFNYAKPPGAGKIVGQPIQLTLANPDAVLSKESHRKLIFPYIPLFHDCHTFVCTVKATASGKSTLPCYLLFKGYW